MSKLLWAGMALAASLAATQSAKADPITFDPLASYGVTTTWNLIEPTDETTSESITVNVTGYAFISSVLGTYVILEEASNNTQVSDTVVVDNGGIDGTGRITFTSLADPLPSYTDGTVLGTEDAVNGLTALMDLPLLNGPDLGITVYSDGAGTLTGATSDSLGIDVPEPATLTLFGLGFAALGFVRRRRA